MDVVTERYDVTREIQLTFDEDTLIDGRLFLPTNAIGTVIFANGSEQKWQNQHNQRFVEALTHLRIAALLLDLLPEMSESNSPNTVENNLILNTMEARLKAAINWLKSRQETRRLTVGILGIEDGVEAALAVTQMDIISSIVCIEPRVLDASRISASHIPTLYITSEARWKTMLGWVQEAAPNHHIQILKKPSSAEILLDEYRTFDQVRDLTCTWFLEHFPQVDVF